MERMINDLLEDRGMSIAELTARLGYQSKTSLVRIMKKQANQRALHAFAERLEKRLELTEKEQNRLNEAMECLHWREDYASSREMLRLLCGEFIEDEEVLLEDAVSGRQMQLAQRYAGAREISIVLLNCQYVPMFGLLLDMVRHQDVRIEHFLMMDEDPERVIHAIGALIPLIYEKNYSGYSYRGDKNAGAQGLRGADLMLVTYRKADGTLCEDTIVFDGDCHGLVREEAQSGSMLRMTGIRREDFTSVKKVFFKEKGPESYVRFCANYAKLEHNRLVYKIKPDVGMEWIPEDILLSALQEGSMDLGSIGELVDTFREVYHERVRNVYEKRCASQLIMKRDAMRKFARSGLLADHFWAMRPFTPQERIRIIGLLKEKMEDHSASRICFLKEDGFLRDAEIAYYDGVGILVTDSSTNYAPTGIHSEVMLVHKGFMRMFKEYFERSLLASHVISQEEAVAFMDELISIAKNEG